MSEHPQVFDLRCSELGNAPGETHAFVTVEDADALQAEVEDLRHANDVMREQWRAWQRMAERAEARVEQLEQALRCSPDQQEQR
jgi:hypothetical protein